MNEELLELRKVNKVRVRHHRLTKKFLKETELSNRVDELTTELQKVLIELKSVEEMPDNEVASCGGSTVVEITTPNGVEITGEAVCSTKDSFNKKLGTQIALGRALTSLGYNG